MSTPQKKHFFLIASAIILTIDALFIVINYFNASAALQSTLNRNSKHYENTIKIAIDIINNNMLQMTTFIAQDDRLNQIFLRGKKAVDIEGGGAGAIETNKARTELLQAIQPAWKEMQRQFKVRQLHYHLGPGSTSFLRVHKPEKFGDNMDNIRHTIVDTNLERIYRTGFETGRVYSGLRGVVPISTIDPETNQKVHVGALETGTAFATLFQILKHQLQLNIAVFLTQEHIEQSMWPDAIDKKFGSQDYPCQCVLESSTSDTIDSLAPHISLTTVASQDTQLVQSGESHFAVSRFPLRDYLAQKEPSQPDSGFFVVWEDVSDQVEQFYHNLWMNIIYAVLGFIIVELAIYYALNAATYRLNRIIADRTQQLQLANQQKDKLFAALAHDLRNPLSPIKGFANYIIDNYDTAPKKRVVDAATTIRDISQNAVSLLENLLQWARYHIEGVKIEIAPIPLSDIVNPIVELYQPMAESKGTIISSAVNDTKVHADKFALETILRNLISNAVKYTKQGLIEVGVEQGNDTVTIFVKDTGIGMDSETLAALFQTITHESKAGTEGEKGTGVGLSLAQELALKMDTSLNVSSQQGHGSRFSLELKKAD